MQACLKRNGFRGVRAGPAGPHPLPYQPQKKYSATQKTNRATIYIIVINIITSISRSLQKGHAPHISDVNKREAQSRGQIRSQNQALSSDLTDAELKLIAPLMPELAA